MVSVNPENRYIYFDPIDPADHKHTLIFNHGLGDTAMGFHGLFLDSGDEYNLVPPTCRVVLPTAPVQPVTLNGGYQMNSWFDVYPMKHQISTMDDVHSRYDQKGLMESVGLITKIVDEEIERLDGKSSSVWLGGFSQGCTLSLATFLLYPEKQLGGALGLSGILALKLKDWNKEVDLELKKKSQIFLYHGRQDPMIPCDSALLSYGLLDCCDIKYSLTVEERLEHSISMREIQKISKFFHKHMI